MPQNTAPRSSIRCQEESPLHVGANCNELCQRLLLQLGDSSGRNSPNDCRSADFCQEVVGVLGFNPIFDLLQPVLQLGLFTVVQGQGIDPGPEFFIMAFGWKMGSEPW